MVSVQGKRVVDDVAVVPDAATPHDSPRGSSNNSHGGHTDVKITFLAITVTGALCLTCHLHGAVSNSLMAAWKGMC